MRRIFLMVVISCLLYSNLHAQVGSGSRVAILPLKAEGQQRAGDISDTLNTLVANTFLASSSLQLVERGQIKTLLSETEFQATGLADESTVAKMGKLLGAQFVLVGSYLSDRNPDTGSINVVLSLRMVSVESSSICKSFMESGEGRTLGDALTKLSANLRGAVLIADGEGAFNQSDEKANKVVIALKAESVSCAMRGETTPTPVDLSFFGESINDYDFVVAEISQILGKDVTIVYEVLSGDAAVGDLPKKTVAGAKAIFLVKLIRRGKIHTFSRESEHWAQLTIECMDPQTQSVTAIREIATRKISGKMYEVFPLIRDALRSHIQMELTPFPFKF